jgi:hypothetical protein
LFDDRRTCEELWCSAYPAEVEVPFGFHRAPVLGSKNVVIRAITEPALQVLADPRLAGAISEYGDALAGLRAGKQKDLEDAIEESAKAVESTMKVLIDQSNLARTGKETADPLIRILIAGNVIPSHADQMLFAAARIRNAAGGHGTGPAPRQTPEDLAVACVAAAGVAITYLGGKLP